MGRRRRKGLDPDSLWIVDKPRGPGSRAVLNDLQRRLGLRSLGHAGTLDPLASGLLVCLSGRFRRLQNLFMGATKVYEARLRFGERSATQDAEGPIVPSEEEVPTLNADFMTRITAPFLGTIDQVPPLHSAVHVDGRRAWKLARAGEEIELPSRQVRIDAIEILDVAEREASLRVTCGPGTYIRSLARDLGEAAGCGAWLSALRRTESCGFRIQDALTPEEVSLENGRDLGAVLSAWPRVEVSEEDEESLRQGARIAGSLPEEARAVFAWRDERPVCRLREAEDGCIRSDLLLLR